MTSYPAVATLDCSGSVVVLAAGATGVKIPSQNVAAEGTSVMGSELLKPSASAGTTSRFIREEFFIIPVG